MDAKEIIKSILSLRSWSQAKLAEESGFKGQSNITGILNRGTSLRVDNFVLLVEAMGCEIIVRDKLGSEAEWRLTVGETQKDEVHCMKATEVIRAIMARNSIKVSTLAARLNIKSNVLSERLSQPNVSIDKMNAMLRAMDYKLVALPRESEIPDSGFEID